MDVGEQLPAKGLVVFACKSDDDDENFAGLRLRSLEVVFINVELDDRTNRRRSIGCGSARIILVGDARHVQRAAEISVDVLQ